MATPRKPTISIYVDRSTHQWIVRDSEGDFWIVPVVENPWDHRQPFYLTEEVELMPVPGHYRNLLGLPF